MVKTRVEKTVHRAQDVITSNNLKYKKCLSFKWPKANKVIIKGDTTTGVTKRHCKSMDNLICRTLIKSLFFRI